MVKRRSPKRGKKAERPRERAKSRAKESESDEEGTWGELIQGPAHEAGLFYNQIHDEIQALRSRIDSKLHNMISGGREDVDDIKRQLESMNFQTNSDSGSEHITAAELGAGIFSSGVSELAKLQQKGERRRPRKPSYDSERHGSDDDDLPTSDEEAIVREMNTRPLHHQQLQHASSEASRHSKFSVRIQEETSLAATSSKMDESYADLRISSSAATEPMRNLTKIATARKLQKINFPDRAILEQDEESGEEEPEKSSRHSIEPFTPNDAVITARKVAKEDAVVNARYDRASPPSRRFFPETPIARRKQRAAENLSPTESEAMLRYASSSEQQSHYVVNETSAVSPLDSEAPEPHYATALVTVESTRSPYADEIRDQAVAYYKDQYEMPLNRTASDLRRSIAPSKKKNAIRKGKASDNKMLRSDAPVGGERILAVVPDPATVAGPPGKLSSGLINPTRRTNVSSNRSESSAQRMRQNEERLDLLMASLEFLDDQDDDILLSNRLSREKSNQRQEKVSFTRPPLHLEEEKKEDVWPIDIADQSVSMNSYASRSIAIKSVNLQSIAQSSVTESMDLEPTHHNGIDILVELEGETEEGVVRVEKVQGRVITDPYGDKGRYTGLLVKGKPYGHGSMHYDDGRSYTGEWKSGRWHGKGRTLFVNGDFFVGEYTKDQRHGLGRYEWSDGRVYDGQFRKDRREGKGTYSWPDGAIYTGDFKDGHRHGQGCYKFKDGSVYTGEFKDGKYHGVGECVWADGRCYRGEWYQGHAHGYGVELRPNGSVRHDGEWRKDRPVRDGKSVKTTDPNRRDRLKKLPEGERDASRKPSRTTRPTVQLVPVKPRRYPNVPSWKVDP